MNTELNLIKKLNKFYKSNFIIEIFSKIFLFFSIVIAIFYVLTLSEYQFYFNSFVRTILFTIFIIASLVCLIYFIIHPLFVSFLSPKLNKYLAASQKIGEYFPTIKDRLFNLLELKFFESKDLYSNELIEASFNNFENSNSELDFNKALNKKQIIKPVLVLIILLIIMGSSFLVFPDLLNASDRIINYSKDFSKINTLIFRIYPGNVKITRGDNLKVRAEVINKKFKFIYLNYADENVDNFESKKISADSTNSFNFTFNSVSRNIKYFFSVENENSNLFNVEVINRPIIKNLKVRVVPPAYTKFPAQEIEDNGDINTIVGSNVAINILSSKILSDAYIIFSDSNKIKLQINSNTAKGNFVVRKNDFYKIIILDEDKNENIFPITYQINATNDLPPEILLLKPSDNFPLTENMIVQTLVKINDDFGFSKLVLNYRLSFSKYEEPSNNFEKISIPITNENEALINYNWNLASLNLVTEDQVSYYFEVFDNDIISGPKSSKTPIYTLRVPSIDEIISESDDLQKETISNIQNVLKETEEIKKDILEVDKNLKSGKEKLTWEDQKKIENILKKQENLTSKIEDIQKNIDDIKNKLSENKMLSNETLEKYMELQELFNELSSDEMKNAMQKINDALKNMMNKQNIQDALKNFQMNEDMFKASIERTMNLLKRVQIEQKIDELNKKIDKLIEQQDKISDQMKKTDPNDKNSLNNLSQQQKELTKQLNQLKKDLDDLNNKMSEFPKEMPLKEMSQAKDEFEKDKADSESQDAEDAMSESELSKADKSQSNVKQSLNKLKKGLMSMKSKMMQNQMQKALNKFKSTINDLIELSKRQEKLKNSTQGIEPNSQQQNKLKSDQNDIREDLQKVIGQLSEFAKQSFAVTPEMGEALGSSLREMNNSLNNLENNNNYGSMQNQTNAMAQLNEAANQLNNMLSEMMQGGEGGGMMSFMQQLQKLGSQQMNLNMLAQQLAAGGQLTNEQMSQLQRLASQQQAVQKSLEELNRELKENNKASKLLGDFNETIKKMEEVVQNLKQNKVNDDVLNKQEKILTRLLDAQRSMNERDFEKKRESKPGENIFTKSPNEIIINQKNTKINIDLIKIQSEGYSKDYEILIKKYFNSIQNRPSL